MENSARRETDAFAKRMAEMSDAPPTFGNYDLIHERHAVAPTEPRRIETRVTCVLTPDVFRQLSTSRQGRQGRSLTIEHRFQRGHQTLELGSAHVGQEMLPQLLHVNARRSAQESPALDAEGGDGAVFVALEDAPLHEALLFD